MSGFQNWLIKTDFNMFVNEYTCVNEIPVQEVKKIVCKRSTKSVSVESSLCKVRLMSHQSELCVTPWYLLILLYTKTNT